MKVDIPEKQIDWTSWYGKLSQEQRHRLKKLNERLSYACMVLELDFFEALEYTRKEE